MERSQMTKSQIFKAAHAEAKLIVLQKGISYAEAFKYSLRRVYTKIEQIKFVQSVLAQPKTPQFMWLRGM